MVIHLLRLSGRFYFKGLNDLLMEQAGKEQQRGKNCLAEAFKQGEKGHLPRHKETRRGLRGGALGQACVGTLRVARVLGRAIGPLKLLFQIKEVGWRSIMSKTPSGGKSHSPLI